MLRRSIRLRVLAILAVLAIAVFAPVMISGELDLNRARTAFDARDYVTATQYYQSAARKLPWKPELWEKSAVSMAHIDTKATIPLFEFARNHGGLSASGWEVYGSAYWAASQDEPALETWLDGLHAYPSHYEFYYEISMAYRGLQNYAAERAWLE
ncbi:MAG: tetratricopeptide repeat protein, partial [Anaerolineales bacterium]